MTVVIVTACLVLTAFNLLLTAVLFRQLGLFVMGTARGVNDAGIAVGRRLPLVEAKNLATGVSAPVAPPGRRRLVVFGSTTCKECARMYPDLTEFASNAALEVRHVIFGRDDDDLRKFVKRLHIDGPVFVATQEVGYAFDVEATPFAFAVDERGVVVGKGLINGSEHVLRLVALLQAAINLDGERGKEVFVEANGTR